jgi:hypothetical protein
VSDDVVPPSYNSAVYRSGDVGRFRQNDVGRDTIPKLAPGIGLIMVLLLSIGLWGAIWLAASGLTAGWLW